MPLDLADRFAIHELVSLHGHLMDERAVSRLDELHTDDAVYDLEDFGMGIHRGLEQLRALVTTPGNHPVGHHVTNIVVTPDSEARARVRSKGMGVMSDGKTGSVVYEDVVVKTTRGWRIERRKVLGRRPPR